MLEPKQVIDKMMEKDLFSQWLGIERLAEGAGFCSLEMIIRPEMCNGFGIAHGGITYSLADSALAFASNSHGQHAVSIETSISHIKPLKAGDTIRALAEEISKTNRFAIYDVSIQDEHGALVAAFRGTVFRKEQEWT
jgi:acyl-CoA thioesterase